MSDKASDVRNMFGTIANRYDFLNHFLSGNVDRLWRRACVREVTRRLPRARPMILDVGCGTGDLAIAFSSVGQVVGCDFCLPMLHVGQEKIARSHRLSRIPLLAGDALALPFRAHCFDAVVSAFVLRNLADAQKGLEEMRRVMRPDGVLAVLDFSMPKIHVLGRLYRFYFLRVLPKLGAMISGVEGPYRYLPDSVQAFPGPGELRILLVEAGFGEVEHILLCGGVAVLLLARVESRE